MTVPVHMMWLKLFGVTCQDVKVFFAPEGVLWIEEGVYVAEERANKNVSKNKYLQEPFFEAMKSYKI